MLFNYHNHYKNNSKWLLSINVEIQYNRQQFVLMWACSIRAFCIHYITGNAEENLEAEYTATLDEGQVPKATVWCETGSAFLCVCLNSSHIAITNQEAVQNGSVRDTYV